jgi:hypothetical protein
MNPLDSLVRFYEILARLELRLGGKRRLADCTSRMSWPRRGVYFFFELGEVQSDSREGLRVTRVGTHALKDDSGTSLWNRLSQHSGRKTSGGGNHRGSVFRLLVGAAIKRRDQVQVPHSWGVGSDPGKAAQRLGLSREQILRDEHNLEVAVSAYIRAMPFLWIDVDDQPGPGSHRGVIERSSIAVLSNYRRPTIDPPSAKWLGSYCDRERVRESGLWNNNHVEEGYEPGFFDLLEAYAKV